MDLSPAQITVHGGGVPAPVMAFIGLSLFLIVVVITKELLNIFYQFNGPDSRYAYTEPEQQALIEKFKARQRRQRFLIVPVLVLVLMMLARRQIMEKAGFDPLNYFTLSGVVVALAFSLYNCRCPGCGHYLGKYGFRRKVCYRCGAHFKEDKP